MISQRIVDPDTKKTIEIQLVKLSSTTYDPIPMSDEDLDEISHWLLSPEEYKPLMVDNQARVYYGMFIDGSISQNGARHGYLTLQFQLDSNHAYGVLQNNDFRVNGTREVKVTSKHNIGKYNEIDIEIELANGQNSITIENLTTGQRLEIRNLPSNVHHILIQNERLKHIKDVDNPSRNMRPYFNKVFIHLTYGVNNIRITGVGKVRLISQAKLTLI